MQQKSQKIGETDLVNALRAAVVGVGIDEQEQSPRITNDLSGSARFFGFEEVLHGIAAENSGNKLLQTHGGIVLLKSFLLLHGDRHLFPQKRNVSRGNEIPVE